MLIKLLHVLIVVVLIICQLLMLPLAALIAVILWSSLVLDTVLWPVLTSKGPQSPLPETTPQVTGTRKASSDGLATNAMP